MNLIQKIKTICSDYPSYIRRYVWPLPSFRREIVVMIDGKLSHGGLTDRFRFILSIYSYCKVHNIPFRLYYVYPCELGLYLVPNKYDWRICDSEISYHFLSFKEIILYVQPMENVSEDTMMNDNRRAHLAILDRELDKKKRIQYHLYGNAGLEKGNYRNLWKELFCLSPYLENRIASVRCEFKEPYESITLRFQQLLGDFEEGDFEILSSADREILIQECLGKINDLYKNGYFSTNKVLITSDSQTFIERVKQLSFVYVIPGVMEHMDYTHNSNTDMNAKSFVDLVLLSEARRLTLLKIGGMYKSGFPAFAAELGGKSYCEIVED